MAGAVLVRGTDRVWPYRWTSLAGGLAIVAGVIFLVLELPPPLPAGLTAGGLFLVVLGVALSARNARRQVWLTPTERGFQLLGRQMERTVADADVLCMSLTEKTIYSQGLPKSRTRTFTVWLPRDDGPPERLDLVTTFPAEAEDPLGPLIGRIAGTLHENARQSLASGGSVLGELWRWMGDRLTVRGPQTREIELRIDEIVAAHPVDKDYCLWRNGVDEPAARIPLTSANAHLLALMLEEALSQRPPAADVVSGGKEGLGRLIFERRPKPALATTYAVAAWCLGAAAAVFAAAAFWDVHALIGTAIAGSLAIVCAMAACYTRRSLFRCHEFGVVHGGWRGERQLHFAEIDSLSYNAVRHFHNGAYVGTCFTVVFEPAAESGKKRVAYSIHRNHADAELEALRDRLAKIIGDRMAARLQNGESVPWTKRMIFHPTHLECRPTGFLGKNKPPIHVPYDGIADFDVDEGKFALFVRGNKKPVVKESVAARNFFPGVHLLMRLMAANAAAAKHQDE